LETWELSQHSLIDTGKPRKACVEVAIPKDRNVTKEEAEKQLKYKSLCAELQRMWKLKCIIIPVIIGATGIVTKGLKKNCEGTLGKRSVASLQQTAVLGTSQIIRKGVQSET
jgi:hypothetical protein